MHFSKEETALKMRLKGRPNRVVIQEGRVQLRAIEQPTVR